MSIVMFDLCGSFDTSIAHHLHQKRFDLFICSEWTELWAYSCTGRIRDNAVVCINRVWKGGVLSPRRLSIDVTRAGPQILHTPTFGSDLNIYGDCQWCAGNRSGTNEIQSTFLLTHRFAFSRTILLALTLNEMSHALLTLCSYQKYPALWPYLSATPDHSCGYTHLHCCYPIWNSFPEVGCSSQPRKYVFDFFLHTILGLLLLVVVISSK